MEEALAHRNQPVQKPHHAGKTKKVSQVVRMRGGGCVEDATAEST